MYDRIVHDRSKTLIKLVVGAHFYDNNLLWHPNSWKK